MVTVVVSGLTGADRCVCGNSVSVHTVTHKLKLPALQVDQDAPVQPELRI